MTILLSILAAYVAVAAYAWWFLISTSKAGIRPTRADILETIRREGLTLFLLCLGWLPMLVLLLIRIVVPDAEERRSSRRPKQ